MIRFEKNLPRNPCQRTPRKTASNKSAGRRLKSARNMTLTPSVAAPVRQLTTKSSFEAYATSLASRWRR